MEIAEQQLGIFACPSCGSLFEGALKFDPSRKCSECGLLVVIPKTEEKASTRLAPRHGRGDEDDSFRTQWRNHDAGQEAADLQQGETFSELMNREGSQRKKNNSGAIWKTVLLMAFLCGLLAVATGIRYFQLRDEARGVAAKIQSEAKAANQQSLSGNEDFKNNNFNQCMLVVQQFMRAKSPNDIVRHVADSKENAIKRLIHYQTNPFHQVKEKDKAVPQYVDVIQVGDEKKMEGLLKWEDGSLTDFVLTKEGSWKIDWEQMVRFSEEFLPAYVSGLGRIDEGVFRVYARRASVGDEVEALWTTLSLYQPKKNLNSSYSKPIAKVVVDKKSEIGKSLESIHANRMAGYGAYGSQLIKFDPADLMRLTLKLKRIPQENGKVKIEIAEVLSNHWLAEPGIDLKVKRQKRQ